MQAVPERARVVVIGAGFAGAATAYRLARAGVRDIILLEREATAGHHASGRNAGLCRQLTDDDVVTDLAIRGAAFLRRPHAGFSTAPLLRQTGSLLVSAAPARLEGIMARAVEHKLPHERVDPDALLARWPRLSGLPAAGAIYFPTDGVIDIHALLQGFLAGARAGGATLFLSTEVRRFRPGREPMTVAIETSRGTVMASCVVNAAGAWASEVGRRAGADSVVLQNYRRHIMVTGRVPQLDRQAPFVWYVDEDELYVRPEVSGYLLSGCDATAMEACDARVAPEVEAEVVSRLRRITPWLADLPIARTWACLRTFAPDERPVVGWDPVVPWLFWVAGLGGHGATACAAIGKMAAMDISQKLVQL
jgi:glycine/D-amino acid oxidase-like deaminating enzyme